MNPDQTPDASRQQVQAEQLFSLKEWMSDISRKLDRMDNKLDGKADLQHVQTIDLRVGVLERQVIAGDAAASYLVPQTARMLEDVGKLKEKSAAIASVDTYRRWVWGTALIGAISTAASVVALIR